MDGLDPPENMVRCMANNYSPLGFWRSWHRSLNLWIVRYLYIPLGGTHRLVATSVLIFTFVALWHDLSPRLLAWGWLVVLFILPEVVARKFFPPSMVRAPLFLQYSALRTSPLTCFYLLCFLCAVWRKVVVSPLLCYRRGLQHSDDDGREPRRICCWHGWCPVPFIPTSKQLEW
jgi:hypothetical protein